MLAPEPLLAGLKQADIAYVLIGGLAVGAHGYVRATKDVDVIIDPAAIGRLKKLFADWRATTLDGRALGEHLFDGEHVIIASTPHGRLDVLPEGEPPLDFRSLHDNAVTASLPDGTTACVVSLQALVTLKRIANRSTPDRSDLRALEIAHGELPESLAHA